MNITDIQQQMRGVFLQEARDLLVELDSSMLELESNPTDSDLLNRLFRAIHTIKGSGATAGFKEVAAFTHHVEELFEEARQGRLVITSEMVDLALKARDLIESLLNAESPQELSPDCEILIQALSKHLPQNGARIKSAPVNKKEVNPSKIIYNIEFRPHPQIFFCGTDPVSLMDELAILGEMTIEALTDKIPSFVELNPEQCFLGWSARLVSIHPLEKIKEVFMFVEDESVLHISEQVVDSTSEETARQVYLNASRQGIEALNVFISHLEVDKFESRRLQNLLRTLHTLHQATTYQHHEEESRSIQDQITFFESVLESKRPLIQGDLEQIKGFCEKFSVFIERLEPNLQKPSQVEGENKLSRKPELQEESTRQSSAKENASVRVDQDKLDRLMRAIGELLIARNAFPIISKKLIADHGLSVLGKELRDAGDHISHISDDLQAAVMSIRMMPVKTVFQRFPRMVRDVTRATGKEVELKLEGTGTELDKTVIEKIGDPLVHLVRNAVDHGVEMPDDREKVGKPRIGSVLLRAFNKGSNVIIEISDDGRGMDPRKLLNKAVEKGLLTQSHADTLDDKAAMEIIFMAGFSTAATVTDISGRGVGMDVVRNNIRQLHGTVSIESEVGKGSTFTITLPTSLMVSQGVLVSAEREEYLLPIDCIQEVVKVPKNRIHYYQGTHFVQIRDTVYPILQLANHFKSGDSKQWRDFRDEVSIALIKTEKVHVGVAVDKFIGEEEVIIKPLGEDFSQIRAFQGATIMGDGRVVLVINPDGLI